MNLGHLTRRFFGALRPGPPRAAATEWVRSVLSPAELDVWRRLPNHDRRHSIAVARGVQRALESTEHGGDRRWLAAALLHDVGKLDSGLGAYGRAVATVSAAAAGPEMADAWSEKRGFTRRVGLYLRHPELGASRIRLAGGCEEAAVWAEAHHDPERFAQLLVPLIPPDVIAALDAADND